MAEHDYPPGTGPETPEELSPSRRVRALGRALFGKGFLPFWVCLGVAAAIVPFVNQFSPTKRISNLDLSQSFSPSYLMTSKTEPNRGYLVGRRDSTVRRSRKNLPGGMWDLKRFGEDQAAGIPEHYLLRSKKYGTVFLIPAEAVEDFEYPFVYAFVRREYPDLDLPEAEWTDLFLNRVYSGLYLRMSLPFDLRKKDGGNGTIRELMMIRGNEMTLVDTRFNPHARFYEEGATLGIFPALSEPPPVLSWLAWRCPTPRTTLLLNNAEPYEVSLLPLPYSLDRLYELAEGVPLRPTLDERFRRWAAPVNEYQEQPAPFDREKQARFAAEREEYGRRLEFAVTVHRTLRPDAVLRVGVSSEGAKAGQLQSQGAWR
jgi:hypothetical protein